MTVLKVLDSCLALEPAEMVAGPDARLDGRGVQAVQSQTQLLEEMVSTCNVRLQNALSAAPPLSDDDKARAADEMRLAKKAREAHVNAALKIGNNRMPDGKMGDHCVDMLSNLTKQRARAADVEDLDSMDVDFEGVENLRFPKL